MKKRHIPLLIGCVILAVFLLAALFPTLFTSYGQKEMFGRWLSPSSEHLLGTNALGYDIFTELVYGTRQTLLVGISSSILTMLLGSFIGTGAAGKGPAGSILNGCINIFVLLPDFAHCRVQLGRHRPGHPCEGHPPEHAAICGEQRDSRL